MDTTRDSGLTGLIGTVFLLSLAISIAAAIVLISFGALLDLA